MPPAVRVENLSKVYRLGQTHAGSVRELVNRAIGPLLGWKTTPVVSTPQAVLSPKRVDEQGQFWALRDVSCTIEQGEVVGIIGKNGAGKSTLLKLLSQITPPTTGRIEFRGRIASLLEVGTGFHPELTGRENVFLNGAILGMTRSEVRSKFDEIVSFAEVDKFIDTPVKRYSSGMYMRLAFAVASHLDPEILIVDEVLAVGDAAFQRKCLGKMQTTAGSGRTVLFVSHNMTAVKSLCSKGIFLEDGVVKFEGSATEATAMYLSRGSQEIREIQYERGDPRGEGEGVRVLSQRVVPLNTDALNTLNVESDFRLEFEWETDQPDIFHINVWAYSGEELCVFFSYSPPKQYERGRHVLGCTIPGRLLNDDIYRFSIMIVADGTRPVYRSPEMLVVEVHDAPRHEGYMGKTPGVLRPHLEWECLSDKQSS